MRLANSEILDERDVVGAGDLIDRVSQAIMDRVGDLESESLVLA